GGGSAGQGGSAGAAGTAAAGGSSGGGGCSPDGHDEDQDSLDDACDNCPTWTNAGQENADDDALGDACEAHPGLPDLRAVYYLETWIAPLLADWSLDADVGVQTDVLVMNKEGCQGSCGADAWWKHPMPPTPWVAETVVRFDAQSAGWAGVLVGDPAGGHWFGCEFEYRPAVRKLGLWRFADGLTDAAVEEVHGVEQVGVSASARRVVRAYVHGSQVFCSFDNELGDSAVLGPHTDPQVDFVNGGMRACSSDVGFESFVIYE
ncbi:MAG: hypothetical protein ACOC1F_11885, partial [Myxococcota bacterium]